MNKFETYCDKYGFVTDKTIAIFKRIFGNNKFKTFHIEAYSLNPYMLFSRIVEKNVVVVIKDGRFIVQKKDRYNTNIVDIRLEYIDDCIVKQHNDLLYEIIFAIYNTYYKLLVAL
jgi:hypothetical protein